MPDHQFQTAIRLIDEANARDPHLVTVDGRELPHELVYSQRLTEWILRLCPNPSVPLLLASRCQHIERWTIPRTDYPPGRKGYLQWRTALKEFHAQRSGNLLRQAGCDTDTIRQVQELNLKKNFPQDPDSQVLEDALCLMFLEHQLPDLMTRMPPETLANALRKSWKKMSPTARDCALQLSLPQNVRAFIDSEIG